MRPLQTISVQLCSASHGKVRKSVNLMGPLQKNSFQIAMEELCNESPAPGFSNAILYTKIKLPLLVLIGTSEDMRFQATSKI